MHTINQNDNRKLVKWQTRSRMKPLLVKGCSSKSFFKNLHATCRKQAIFRIKIDDGKWTATKSELEAVP